MSYFSCFSSVSSLFLSCFNIYESVMPQAVKRKVITSPQCGELNPARRDEPPQGWPVFQVYTMPRSICLYTSGTSSGNAGCGFPSPAGRTLKSTLTLLYERRVFSPLFLKEGAGEIASGVVSLKQHIFQTESLCQTFLSLTGQTSGLPILIWNSGTPEDKNVPSFMRSSLRGARFG